MTIKFGRKLKESVTISVVRRVYSKICFKFLLLSVKDVEVLNIVNTDYSVIYMNFHLISTYDSFKINLTTGAVILVTSWFFV